MSQLALNALLTKMLLDQDFAEKVLNKDRDEAVKGFALSTEEKDFVMQIQAEDAGEFIGKVHSFMVKK